MRSRTVVQAGSPVHAVIAGPASRSGATYRKCACAALLATVGALGASSAVAGQCEEPGTPNHEKATALNPNEVRLDWNNTASESNVYFDIEGKNDPSLGSVAGPNNNGRNHPVTYTVRGLRPHAEHCFRMWARVGPNGCRSGLPSAWACAQTPGPPDAPSGIGGGHPQPNDLTQVLISWSHDGWYDETSFQVYEVGQKNPVANVPASLQQVIVSGVHPNEKHCYYVQGVNQWGASPPSGTMCISTAPIANGTMQKSIQKEAAMPNWQQKEVGNWKK